MNIKEAKEQISNAMKAYFTKNQFGKYVIPIEKQRPVFLMGPPGIGKTAIMEQIAQELDVGFRVFKLDSSNLQTWDATPVDEMSMDDLLDRMNAMVNRVKPDRNDMDMVCEIMLKLGIPLTNTIDKVSINAKAAYLVKSDSLLLVCLEANISPEDVDTMADYAPAKVVISRDSFANDTAMANAHYILRDRGIELKLV